ncbi:XRE family transcriptional regulator, partial [Thomasclavelia ramosa]
HLNDSHLGKIINGKTKNPGIDYLLAIAEALELTNDEFAELCGYKNDK